MILQQQFSTLESLSQSNSFSANDSKILTGQNAVWFEKLRMLEALLDNVNAYIYVKDLEGKYIYINQNIVNLFGIEPCDIIGKDDSEFFDLSRHTQLLENDQRVINEKITIESEEENYIKAISETRYYQTTKSPIFNDDGEVVGLYGVSTDITEQKKLQKLLEKKEKLLHTVLNNVDAYIYMKDEARHFLYVNNKVAELFGHDAEYIAGKLDSEVLPKEIADHFWQSDKEVFGKDEKTVAHEVIDSEQGELHYQSVKIPFQYSDDQKALIGFSTDVTELYRLKQLYKNLAIKDHLTQLYNRRYFQEHAKKEFKRAERHNEPLSVLAIDVDYFKNVNDTYGHAIGDKVLFALSKNLELQTREHDIIARTGGEEFSILLPNTDLACAMEIAERIRSTQMNLANETDDNNSIFITVSVGIVTKTPAYENFDEMFIAADKALYCAKSNGRNCISAI